MTVVIDASVALSWCFEDEQTEQSEAALDALATAEGIVPALWNYEIANGLIAAVRRGRLSEQSAAEALVRLTALPIHSDDIAVPEPILRVAAATGLTAYDAAYLEVALRRQAPLATIDRDLAKAAKKVGVALLR